MSDEKEWFEKIDWSKITKEHVDYALSEANTNLKISLESCSELDKKSFFILSGIIGYVSTLFPFVISSSNVLFIVPSCILIAGFLISLVTLVHSIKAQKYFSLGGRPENTLFPDSLSKDYLYFLKCEVISRQDWIEKNEKLNSIKGKRINVSLIILFTSIVAAFVCYSTMIN